VITKGSGVWNPGAPEPKHGDYRPGTFKLRGQSGANLWKTEQQRWCAVCKGWKPAVGVEGHAVCVDCLAVWERAPLAKSRPKPQPESLACEEHCNCPLCQPYYPDEGT